MKKKLSKFQTEDEEHEFWAAHDSTEYIEWQNAKRVTLSRLKPSTKAISVQFPESLLDGLK